MVGLNQLFFEQIKFQEPGVYGCRERNTTGEVQALYPFGALLQKKVVRYHSPWFSAEKKRACSVAIAAAIGTTIGLTLASLTATTLPTLTLIATTITAAVSSKPLRLSIKA